MKTCRKIGSVMAAMAAAGIAVGAISFGLPVREADGKVGEAAEQDFEICQSFNFTTGDYRDTIIHVVADTSCQDVKELYGKIQDFQTAMNGESDRLTINLYNSPEDISNNICAGTKVYYRGETE